MMIKQPLSTWVSHVLSPALSLWLRSQLDHVENLQVQITSKNRQLLTGFIPHVALSADHASYQGIHIRHASLTGAMIRINVGQMLKGKPFRLLEPVPVRGSVRLTAADLQASLRSDLLATGLRDAVALVIPAHDPHDLALEAIAWHHVTLDAGQLTLAGAIPAATESPRSVTLQGGLSLGDPHTLCLDPLTLSTDRFTQGLPAFTIDLGPQVELDELAIAPDQIVLTGGLTITPAEETP
ncbi:DUF2993 domain-containing protein [Spirulina major CS-329]|uniref:LmeA family phospholipid-binding protein n=1 Tax=Spirulina TaxID=1154 RepID=UPI00232E2BE7|nr:MULTISPECIES: DUF2993 domain-containing protein [Spirulina]MDB9502830.1 DUF2993 domain-containing protein [Spirulina major CS-329]